MHKCLKDKNGQFYLSKSSNRLSWHPIVLSDTFPMVASHDQLREQIVTADLLTMCTIREKLMNKNIIWLKQQSMAANILADFYLPWIKRVNANYQRSLASALIGGFKLATSTYGLSMYLTFKSHSTSIIFYYYNDPLINNNKTFSTIKWTSYNSSRPNKKKILFHLNWWFFSFPQSKIPEFSRCAAFFQGLYSRETL